MRRIDYRMVMGGPDSPEAIEWLRDALAAMQKADSRLDVDFGGIEERLQKLEARPEARLTDLSGITDWLEALDARIAALEAREQKEPVDTTTLLDPLLPANWLSLEAAKAALITLVTREAARRTRHSVELYERMVTLDALVHAGKAVRDQELELMQHQEWAGLRAAVEGARQEHLSRIAALTSVMDARAYDVMHGWPDEVDHADE